MSKKEFIIEEEVAYWEKEGKKFENDPFEELFPVKKINENDVVDAVNTFIVNLIDENKISTKAFAELDQIVTSAMFHVITVDEMVEQVTKIYSKPDIWEVLVDCGYFPF